MIRLITAALASLWPEPAPHRADVLAALTKLPPIPEADRMRTRRFIDKPRSFQEWAEKYDRRKRA